jgi:hypothetical protein
MSGLIFFVFRTDFPQNVINEVSIYQDWEHVEFPPQTEPDDVLRTKFASSGRYIVVVSPIAGGPLVCGARDLSISVNRGGHIPPTV